MTAASFERIDYQTRNNKHIERRLIFDRLARASNFLSFDRYRYIGFGSMWFVDFRLAHRLLGIHRMLSMERSEHSERAEFNKPLRCIDVKGGESTKLLSEIPPQDWLDPVVCWLDYDGLLQSSVVKDIETLLDNAAAGSFVAISVNAKFQNYRPKNIQGPRLRKGTALGQIESLLGAAVVPQRFEKPQIGASHPDVTEQEFPDFLGAALLSWMIHKLSKAKRVGAEKSTLEFLPLANFCHKDGVEMVTVGGSIVDAKSRDQWLKTAGVGISWSEEDRLLPRQEVLDLVPVTVKEKLALDRCLPHGQQEFVDFAKGSGIRLPESQVRKYWEYYKHFPLFLETSA